MYVNSGFTHILSAEEFRTDESEMGSWPVGPDCLDKHPELREYIIEEQKGT